MFVEAKIAKMFIKNSEITSDHWIVGGWEKMRIEELTLENVLIDGIFRMQNAYIGTLKTKNFRKGRNLDINYEGANFKFQCISFAEENQDGFEDGSLLDYKYVGEIVEEEIKSNNKRMKTVARKTGRFIWQSSEKSE